MAKCATGGGGKGAKAPAKGVKGVNPFAKGKVEGKPDPSAKFAAVKKGKVKK